MKKLEKAKLIKIGLFHAAGAFIYISAVALLMFNGQNIFGDDGKSFLIPLFILLLFVISATITSFLILGKPIYLYLNGSKKEALTLLFITLAWLVIFLFCVALTLALS